MPAPRLLYAHGFASGPRSAKGRAVAEHLSGRGLKLDLLDMRVPTANKPRLSAMIELVRLSITFEDSPIMKSSTIQAPAPMSQLRAVAIGSSLGGLAVARAAERDPRIMACVLLAPAFRVAQRWRTRIGEEAWTRWETEGVLEVDDHASDHPAGGKLKIDFGFIEEAGRVDGDAAPDDARAAEGFGRRWPDLKMPTVIIHGRRDDTVDPELSRTFAKHRPNVRLVEVDDDHQLLSSIPLIRREVDRVLADLGVA